MSKYFVKLNTTEIQTVIKGLKTKCAGHYFETYEEAEKFIKERDSK